MGVLVAQDCFGEAGGDQGAEFEAMTGAGADHPGGRTDGFDDEAFVVGDGVIANLALKNCVVFETG